MTDLEISKALALAIGWKRDRMIEMKTSIEVWWQNDDACEYEWRKFDYRDWNVIGPIAERYDCFPTRATGGGWIAWLPTTPAHLADTPQKAIALAVIGGLK